MVEKKSGNDISLRLAMTIIGSVFFVCGFITWLNGPLITFVKLAFSLTDIEAFTVPLVFYLSYLVFALPASALLRRIGMKRGMALGLMTMAVGAATFSQFATLRFFPGTLTALFVIGGGLAVLQTAVNPYITLLGPIEGAAQRIAIMGICNKTAGILAPIAFGMAIMRGVGSFSTRVASASPAAREQLLQAFANKVYLPYLVMAGLLVLLAVGVIRSPLPEVAAGDARGHEPVRLGGLSRFPHLWLGVLCMFLYMGAEVMAGDAIGTYGAAFGLPVQRTAYFTSLTLAGMLAGYVMGFALIPRFVKQESYLAFSAVFGICAVLGAYFTRDYLSVGLVASLGFANAMMWPAIFPLAIRGLGRYTEAGSAIVVMSISGGAIIPQLYALLKQHLHFQLVFLILMAPSYMYILYYALRSRREKDPASEDQVVVASNFAPAP